ncbi:hypothetical protein [Pantoea agglomerans]|uniref:hypothetical protein n=1 Tax=Enterobacter agglomerans TaxID=549 RepID=UPI0034CE37AF
MREIKYDAREIKEELESKEVWEQFTNWAGTVYQGGYNTQIVFEYLYEVFKMNEVYFIDLWKGNK